MVIRWNRSATLVVVVCLTFIHGEQLNATDITVDSSNSKFEDLCPCLPVDICPRVFGTKPEDAKYLGDIKKCEDDNAVRCCGASASFVVGKSNTAPEVSKEEIEPIPAIQPDILTRANADDVQENEISDAESESVKPLSAETTEILSLEESKNIANFHFNGETDEEAAESESVIKTANADAQHERHSNDAEQSGPSAISETAPKSHRKPKNLDSVLTVYPNTMSGIPKTTPRNLPETNEMKMFDQEIGMDLHLVFSKTSVEPETTTTTTPRTTVDSISKQPPYRFAKRRRQYKPIQKVTTTESPVEETELKQTTIRSRTRQRGNIINFTSRPTEESTNSTTRPSRAKLTTTTIAPSTQEKEILQTSEDDKSHNSRFRLFNARYRLNYLRRNTTAATTSTTESSIETTTTGQTTQLKRLNRKRPSKVDENVSEIRTRSRPSKMNETLVHVVDANHKNMISNVRVALMAATTENKITEIPRSFASEDISNRVKIIEGMLVEEMVKVYVETKMKLRGDQPKRKLSSTSHNIPTTTETNVTQQKSNSNRPFRGSKKFQMSDLLDKTPVVTMSPNEFRRTMRVRSTTVAPEQQVSVDVVPTTRRPHRRPTTKLPVALDRSNIGDASSPEKNKEGSFRRRVIRRKYKVEPSSITTLSPPVQSVNAHSTTSTTIPTTLETSTSDETIESTSVLSESKNDFREELQDKFENDTQDETQDESQDVKQNTSEDTNQDNTKETVDEQIGNVDVEDDASSTITPPNLDVISDFKPSPLWSISNDEKDDFIIKEQNHSYDMNMDEREQILRKYNRRSRNTFDAPVHYLNGFVPAGAVHIIGPIPKSSKLGDDAKVRYNLPRESKTQFSKN